MAETIRTGADGSWGTVVLPFGRYFAGKVDLLTRDRLKAIEPIAGVSPLCAVGDPDPEMLHFADSEHTNDRVRTDVRKNLGARLASSGADYLVVDNTPALLWLRTVNERSYTVVDEKTDFMNWLWNNRRKVVRNTAVKPPTQGMTDELWAAYDAFVDVCLEHFDPSRIILVRSHVARFWMTDDVVLAPTNGDAQHARFLRSLDDRFLERTGCRLLNTSLGCFPSGRKWQSFDDSLRVRLEEDLLPLIGEPGLRSAPEQTVQIGNEDAADHVVRMLANEEPVDPDLLRAHFATMPASYDDLLALAYLQQETEGNDELVADCVRLAVANEEAVPVRVTRQRYEDSLAALRGWEWNTVDLPDAGWVPQAAVEAGRGAIYRYLADGSIEKVVTTSDDDLDTEAVVDGRLPITPLNVRGFLQSWPTYLERGRRGITVAPQVSVADADELVDSCGWLDWPSALASETLVIATPTGADAAAAGGVPTARTDLSFVFDPRARLCTVGGGLMDQVTHIALFDDVCRPHDLTYYLDDFRYTWWRSHNGFEASRLSPGLDARRITRLVSQPLVERFRREVTTDIRRKRLPWLYNQTQAWVNLGLREAMIVTRNYPNSRTLMERFPEFPVLIYSVDNQLRDFIEHPPRPVSLFTTQHRIAIHPRSTPALHRVFSYAELEANGFNESVAETAKTLTSAPYVAMHVRRGDYLRPQYEEHGWHPGQAHYIDAVVDLVQRFGTDEFNVAIFSDDLEFVREHASEYGLDLVKGDVLFVHGNQHFDSIFDSYLMSLCEVIVGSVGFFSATTAILADPPRDFIRARPKPEPEPEPEPKAKPAKAANAGGPAGAASKEPTPAGRRPGSAPSAQPARSRRTRDLIRRARRLAARVARSAAGRSSKA